MEINTFMRITPNSDYSQSRHIHTILRKFGISVSNPMITNDSEGNKIIRMYYNDEADLRINQQFYSIESALQARLGKDIILTQGSVRPDENNPSTYRSYIQVMIPSNTTSKPRADEDPNLNKILAESGLANRLEHEFKVSTLMLSRQETSPQALMEWSDNMRNLQQYAFDELRNLLPEQEDSYLQRLAFLTVMNSVNAWLAYPASVLTHEAGHGAVDQAAGRTDIRFGYDDGSHHDGASVAEVFLAQLNPLVRAYTTSKATPTSRDVTGDIGAGMNMNTLYSRGMYEAALQKNSHVSDMATYSINKMAPLLYFMVSLDGKFKEGDPSIYVNYLKTQGIQTSVEDIAKYQALAVLLSGGTLSGIKSAYQFVRDGEDHSGPIGIQLGDTFVAWPEFNVFFSRQGLTLQSMVGLIVSPDLTLTPAVETPILGNAPQEASIGGSYRINEQWTVSPRVSINTAGNTGLAVDAQWRPDTKSPISVYGHIGTGQTLEETRWTPDGGTRAYLGVKYHY